MRTTVDLEQLLSQMTLDEKIGQLMQVSGTFYNDIFNDVTGIVEYFELDEKLLTDIGGLLGTNSAEVTLRIQKEHMEKDRNKIPKIFLRDVIHGFRTIYPIPLALSCSFDTDIIKACTGVAAKEAAAGGIQATYAPVADCTRDPRWGRVMETCGEDPYLASVMAAAMVEAYQGENLRDHDHIAACVKHFAAYGAAEAGRDYNTAEVSEYTLREYYLPAYKACVDAGVRMVMPAFSAVNGVPATINRWLMKTVLREEWGFKGLTVSDWGAIDEVMTHSTAASSKEAAKQAFSCECDVNMMSPGYYKHLPELIEEGVFTEADIDRSVMRVLQLKKDLGLFEDPFRGASKERENELFLCKEHREIVRRAAEDSAVLLKNVGVLPFSKEVRSIALIGPFADEHQIIGPWACGGKNEESITVRQGIEKLLSNTEVRCAAGCNALLGDTDTSGFAEAVALAKESEVVVLCLGEPQDYTGESKSRAELSLPGMQMELAKQVLEANQNTAVVLFNGRPLILTELQEFAPAILEMWFPGTEGGHAVANLLFGEINPSGKLTMSFPKAVGQIPIYYNHPNTGRPKQQTEGIFEPYHSNYMDCGNLPLYFFGQGLSYTEFVYEKMTLDKDEMGVSDSIRVEIQVRNAGMCAGKEVVQLYMRDLAGTTIRPVQKLIGFEKIELKPGERKTVTFTVTEPMLRMWNSDMQYVSEPGEFTLSVGYADHMYHTKHFVLK